MRRRRDFFRRVHSICTYGPVIKMKWSHAPIIFSEKDLNLRCFPHTDAIVISANISGWMVTKILVDNGSSVDIIFASTFDRMYIDIKLLQSAEIPLMGFGSKRVEGLGKLSLPISFGTIENPRTNHITFDVVDMQYPYSVILGRGFLNKFETIVHQAYLFMKMPAAKGIITVHGD